MEIMDKPLTKNIRPDRAFATLADYESTGGYQGLRKTISQLQPKDVQQWVKDAGLRGRGGAARDSAPGLNGAWFRWMI